MECTPPLPPFLSGASPPVSDPGEGPRVPAPPLIFRPKKIFYSPPTISAPPTISRSGSGTTLLIKILDPPPPPI